MNVPGGRWDRHPSPVARTRGACLTTVLVVALLAAGARAEAAPGMRETQRRLNAVAARVNALSTALAETEAHIHTLSLSIARATGSLSQARAGMSFLARGLYMSGLDNVTAIFGSDSIGQLADRMSFVEHLQSFDRDVLQRVSISRIHFARQRASLDRLVSAQRKLFGKLRDLERSLAKLFAAQKSAADAFRRQYRSSRGDAPGPRGPGPFVLCPVADPHAYSDDFGAPRYNNGRHVGHQGNDILAPRNTEIRAPFAGRIKRSHSGLGGNQVYVYNSAGHVFNAHLDHYSGATGTVPAGTVIGFVGDTGDARGGPTHDHFEWHPGDGPAVDPYRYLNMVC